MSALDATLVLAAKEEVRRASILRTLYQNMSLSPLPLDVLLLVSPEAHYGSTCQVVVWQTYADLSGAPRVVLMY